MKNLRKFLLAIIVMMVANVAMAQSTKIHVVERGETIESIAKKYNVTKDEIVKLNPDVAQFVYVGMELTIPVPVVSRQVASPITETKSEPSYNTYTSSFITKTSSTQTSVESSDEVEFSNWGLGYIAPFDAFDAGIYGLQYNILKDRKIRGQLFAGMNIGLVDSDYTSFLVRLGPNYSAQVAENISFYVPLTVDLTWSQHPEYKNVTDKSDLFGNTVNFNKKESKTEFGWGLSVTPSLAIKLGGLYLNAGVALMWNEASSQVDAGVMLGICFSL